MRRLKNNRAAAVNPYDRVRQHCPYHLLRYTRATLSGPGRIFPSERSGLFPGRSRAGPALQLRREAAYCQCGILIAALPDVQCEEFPEDAQCLQDVHLAKPVQGFCDGTVTRCGVTPSQKEKGLAEAKPLNLSVGRTGFEPVTNGLIRVQQQQAQARAAEKTPSTT